MRMQEQQVEATAVVSKFWRSIRSFKAYHGGSKGTIRDLALPGVFVVTWQAPRRLGIGVNSCVCTSPDNTCYCRSIL